MLQIVSLVVVVLIALVNGVVVEHRITIETHFRLLQKRVETCTSPGVVKPNGSGPGSTICDPSQTCCYGGNSVFCIPLDATCCTFVDAGGWCPSGRACQEAVNYIPGLASSCIVPITAPTPTYTTVAPTSYTQPAVSTPSPNESSSSSGLAAGSIAGISISVACSVLGLLFGVGFKIWKHRRNERRQREQAAAAVQSADLDGKGTDARMESS